MHAAARRAVTHFFLEPKRDAEKIQRGGHVAIEEIGDDLRWFRGDRHGFSLLFHFSLGEKGRGMRPRYHGFGAIWSPHPSPSPVRKDGRLSKRPLDAACIHLEK